MTPPPLKKGLKYETVEDETQRPPYNRARNKEESCEILRCILSRFVHVIPTDIYIDFLCYLRLKYILPKDSLRYLETDATSSIV